MQGDDKMKLTKSYGFSGLMILLIIIQLINATAISTWPVQKDDELNYTYTYQNYDENNTLTINTSASISIIIKNVSDTLTYDAIFDVNDDVGDYGNNLKNHYEGVNLTSSTHFLPMIEMIIYTSYDFAALENEWAMFIGDTDETENFWYDNLTDTFYSADEITNMKISSSSNAYGYKISASWDEYKNLPAGSTHTELKYSKDGILLKCEYESQWVEGGSSDRLLENNDAKTISSFPLQVFGFCSILGIVVLFLKKR